MKLKEVCESTGLSRKTIRLYEEKGLLVPQMEHRNGRDYREYTQADVDALREIATLRRAWFTMDEIARMQQNPETIGEIFPQYLQWLENQKETLERLLTAARAIEPGTVQNIEELSRRMQAADRMPLPAMDIQPHFRHLDAQEQRPPKGIPAGHHALDGRETSVLALGLQDPQSGNAGRDTKTGNRDAAREGACAPEGTAVAESRADSRYRRDLLLLWCGLPIRHGNAVFLAGMAGICRQWRLVGRNRTVALPSGASGLGSAHGLGSRDTVAF